MKKTYVKPKMETLRERIHDNREEQYMNVMVDAGRPASIVKRDTLQIKKCPNS